MKIKRVIIKKPYETHGEDGSSCGRGELSVGLNGLESERLRIAFQISKGQRELLCMPPAGGAGTRTG